MDLGVLLTLPVESIAVRAIVASACCVLLLRVVLRAGLRSVGARVAAAVVPATALIAVGVWAARGDGWHLPSLMLPVDAADALPIPVSGGYVHFAPSAWPLLVGTWAAVAGVLVARRLRTLHRTHREAARLGEPAGASLVARVARTAASLRVPTPRVRVAATCPGGALVSGVRRPVLLLGQDLLDELDEAELEGVLAHELAHVRRRDNLVAAGLGLVRDLAFFVPGGRWALTQLHRERERAADQRAVAATGRPGALASGLLKVLELSGRRGAPEACAALVPSHALVERVTDLVEPAPALTRTRAASEAVVVLGVALVAVVGAVALPALLAGADRERDALAVAWTSAGGEAAPDAPAVEARAFDVYRGTRLEVGTAADASRGPVAADTSSLEDRPSTWRACADPARAACPTPTAPQVGLGLAPRPTITLDERLPWQATPAFAGPNARDGRVPGVYWLQRIG